MSYGTTRRGALAAVGAAAAAFGAPVAGRAEDIERHGISAFGDLKYPADFKHFDYVNPHAPKGGTFSVVSPTRIFNQGLLTFNSLNSYILKGDAAQGMELTFASLMVRAFDEPDAVYGLAARAVQISADRLTWGFFMREGITFHDGSPLTAHDVAYSLRLLNEKGHPIIQQMLRNVVSVEAPDHATAVVRLAPGFARDMPLFLAGLPIFSRQYYSARPFDETTFEPPLGSGPYKVGRLEPGRFIEYERVNDWWGSDLPAARGQYNFDLVRYEYYRAAISPSRASPAGAICSAKSWSHGSGPRATISRPSARGASSATSSPTTRQTPRKAGTSTRGSRSSRTSGCVRLFSMHLISSGSMRTSCMRPINGPNRYSKIRT
jgi:microcin C transport system substrate-binding protein